MKPALAQRRASSKMSLARATGCKGARSWTRRFLSFQSDHATNQTSVSKPLQEGLATAFRARNHQTATGSLREGAKSAMPKNRSTRNQVSQL
jgi:ethanolamine ammonia-lyase small subunit